MKDDANRKNSPPPKSFKAPKVHFTFSGGIYIDPNTPLVHPDMIDEEIREKIKKLQKERPELSTK